MGASYWFAAAVAVAGVIAFLLWDRRRIAKTAALDAGSRTKPFPAVPYKKADTSATGGDGGSGGAACSGDGGGGDGC